MRIRELLFKDFRSFRGERRITFTDPLTSLVRPVTVLAGSNGSGKTTILETIEALLAFVLEPDNPSDLITEAFETSLICMQVELSARELTADDEQPGMLDFLDIDAPSYLHIVVGRRDLAPGSPEREWPNLFCRLVQRGVQGKQLVRKNALAEKLRKSVSLMHQGKAELRGGLIYFPHNRQLGATRGGPIEPPPEERAWRLHFSPSDRWQGSLEQLWVWQNYLDLERGSADHKHLTPFVASVQSILGKGRAVLVREGRALVSASWSVNGDSGSLIQLDQLPSGEQQTLLLFGELARRRRPGVVIAIDEVENSLHPTLQRQVMGNLHAIAREWDAQVIVATHSLEVIHSVRGGAFINLDFPEDRFDLPVMEAQAGDES